MRISITLPDHIATELEVISKQYGISMASLIRMAVGDFLAEREKREKR